MSTGEFEKNGCMKFHVL